MTEKGYKDWEVECHQFWEANGSRLENQDWEGLEGDTRIGKRTPGLENAGKDWEGDIRIGMRENQDWDGGKSVLGYQDREEGYQDCTVGF
jgi:hypothetical protein